MGVAAYFFAVSRSGLALISQFFTRPLSFSQIPTIYRNAVIATEDRCFWWDPGFDPVGLLRSLIIDVDKDGYIEGGSTITQQLVDNTTIHHRKNLIYNCKDTKVPPASANITRKEGLFVR